MRSKKLLAFLLVFCLLLSNMAPLASAVEVGTETVVSAQKNSEETENKAVSSPFDNSLLLSDENAEQDVPTMRDYPVVKSEIETAENADGDWQITAVENPGTSLLTSEVPECIAELKEVAELYSADEVVTAFVVMEDQPLAETYSSPRLVSAAVEKALIEKQDAVISSIEKTILNGKTLDVRYQFAYLTNSFSIKTEFANLEKIAYLPGVKTVFVMPVYDPCTTSSPNTSAAGAMTGVHQVWEELEYTGSGMKIAIIDTGLDLDHPSFAADPALGESSMTVEDVAAVLKDLNAYARKGSITAEDLYRSAKVPYAFNYVDASLRADHSADSSGDHGTHVAGIAAANAVEGTSVVGMAPDAQLVIMKVFGQNGGAYADDIVAALEDAMTLGCDVVNASLGSPRGFSASGYDELDMIYERLASQDIIATFSAGNEGTSANDNMWGTDQNHTQNPDNATVGSPSTWVNTLSIASAENCEVQTPYFTLGNGEKVFFNNDSYGYYYGYTPGMAPMIDVEAEYVVIDGLGYEENFYDDEGNSLVDGKVAVVYRGTINFGAKILNAQNAGAIACIIANNVEGDIFNFMMNDSLTDDDGNLYFPSIPACMIDLASAQAMEACETKTMVVSDSTDARVVEGGQMSSFSSWGPSPSLQLVPDITGIGGNVYSCYDGGNYGLMSGTSMSAPQVAGVTALVMQHLYEIYPNAPDGTIRDLAEAMMMSTAEPIISTDSGVEASPRQQGAGLVNAYKATTTETYLTVGGGRPKAELGDSTTGVYKFSFEIHNIGDEAETYTLSSSLLTEYVDWYGGELFFMNGMNVELDGTVEFNKDSVTVPAGGKANVTVTITLADSDKAYFAQAWKNGGYVEGYIYLSNEDGEAELSLPFMGFYGDWTDAPIFDTAYWYDNSFWGVDPADGMPEGNEYYNVFWTDLGGQNWVLGMNPYSGAVLGADGNIAYDPANNILSPNGDKVLDNLSEIYLSLLRNAKTLTFTYTVDGEVMHEETYLDNGKTMYISGYGQIVPWIYSWYGDGMYDYTDAEGETLASGTEVLLTIDATIDYGTGGDHSIQIPITVDTQKPELLKVQEQASEDGTEHQISLQVSDDVSLAAVYLMSSSGTAVYDVVYDYQLQDMGDGTKLAVFDITDKGTEFTIAVCDYGCNEGYYKVEYTLAEDGNLPEMDTDQLYAYRVLDNYIYSDHMYGWVSMNKPASADEYANITVWSDDYMEYAAINAAEFAGGKIFAVDAVYNFVVMDPGLWSRQTICNLGVNIIDMTFDDSTDTMYLLSKQGSYTYLYTVDLLTGELTQLKNYGYYSRGPWAIADDDNGTLYAIKAANSNIYTLDVEGGTYAMTAVTDADGAKVVIKDSNGANVSCSYYSQSITWIDGTLYWAYLKSSYYSSAAELISINTTDWSYVSVPYAAQGIDSNGDVITYYPVTELVGLLSLEATDYVIPESDTATKLMLDTEEAILKQGESLQLTASALPWNYDLTDVTWSSSDETIATVDSTGFVSSKAPGTVTITATHGDLTAECVINVVKIEGSFNAYNYYSGDGYDGYMIHVDLESMDYYLDNMSPIDFLAGDYNGHNGYFYGYDEGGQLYCYDLEKNEVTALGAVSISGTPVDMAYDYTTGLMYLLTLNFSTYESKLYTVNMVNGAVNEEGTGQALMTLACDSNGQLYAGDAYGYLNELYIQDYSAYGMGMYLETYPVIDEPLGDLYYLQSMCYDHNNEVFLWACCDAVSVYWIDIKGETPVVVSLGDPTESGIFEFVGLHVIPEQIPELPETAVSSITAEDMLIFTGYEKVSSVTVKPFNATCQNVVMTSSDETVVSVTESGNLLGVSAGTATITATLNDTVGGTDYTVEFTVTVRDAADNMYAHLLTDVSTYNAQLWIQMDPGEPSVYEMLAYLDYTIFTAEYYNGKIYTYGYDAYDWEANWQFFVLDAETFQIETQIDMGESFPYVYDMTYDYNTSAMYLLAGAGEDSTDLYVANMETGEAVLLMETEPLLMAIAASPDGKLYAIEQSGSEFDWDTWSTTYTSSKLHAIDPIAATIEEIGETGILSNMIGSMSYDYDTDTMYWASFAQTDAYVSNLSIMDLETGAATSLGSVGVAGAQVGGLFFVCDSFPEENMDVLHKLIMTTTKASVVAGYTTQMNALAIPMGGNAEITWASSDETVATVDENGLVTGVKQGKAVITATATLGDLVLTAEASVAVLNEDASFLTYNVTDKCWTNISRADTTVATNLVEPEEYPEVVTFTSKGMDVYGYDVNGQLFNMNAVTLERTNIGDAIDVYAEEGYLFDIRDMAYDAANDRVLLLASRMLYDEDYADYYEIYGGCDIYAVDLATGELTVIHNIAENSHVFALTVDTEGTIFYYSTYNDYVYKLDLAAEETTVLVSMQTQSIYGDEGYDYSLYFDDLTDTLYMLHTSNGRFYKIHTIDAKLGTLVQGNYAGEIEEVDDYGWTVYYGDDFNGLSFVVIKEGLTWDEDGEIRFYENGEAVYAGLVQDDEGNYYYINSTKKAVKSCTYGIGEAKTNGLLPAGVYEFDDEGKMVNPPVLTKNGLVVDEDGEIRYYVDGIATYAGLVRDDEGNYYYINSSLKAVKSCTYSIGEAKTNGLLPAGIYEFGADGKMINAPTADDLTKNGLITDEDGEIRYYVDGVATYAGLVQDAEGNYYYINSTKKAVKSCTYAIGEAKTNGLLPAGVYEFGDDGKMILD